MPESKAKIYNLVRSNLHDQVYTVLKEMIADQRFNPGSSINVEKLTRELGVSRTPIWEAVRRLEQEGIVVHTPYKGIRVRELTRKTAIELYVVREALEALAARLGAEAATPEIVARMERLLEEQTSVVERQNSVAFSRTDHEFHMIVCESGGNELLAETLEGLRYKALTLSFRLSPFFSEFLEIHHEILNAFRNRDGFTAEQAIRRHHRRMIEIINATPWKNE